MKQAVIGLLFLLACCAWTVRAEEILYVHNSESGEITMISIPGHEIIGQIQIGKWMDYLAASPDGRILYVNRINTFGNVPDRPNKLLKLGRYPQRMVIVNVPERRSQ